VPPPLNPWTAWNDNRRGSQQTWQPSSGSSYEHPGEDDREALRRERSQKKFKVNPDVEKANHDWPPTIPDVEWEHCTLPSDPKTNAGAWSIEKHEKHSL
jgi:hypothetical protein